MERFPVRGHVPEIVESKLSPNRVQIESKLSPNRVLFEFQSISSPIPVHFQFSSQIPVKFQSPFLSASRGKSGTRSTGCLLALRRRGTAGLLNEDGCLLVSGQSWNAESRRWRARAGTLMCVCYVVWGAWPEAVSREICQKQAVICQGVLQTVSAHEPSRMERKEWASRSRQPVRSCLGQVKQASLALWICVCGHVAQKTLC